MVPLWMKKMKALNSVKKTLTKFCSAALKLSQLNQKEEAPHLPRYTSSKFFDSRELLMLSALICVIILIGVHGKIRSAQIV